MKIFSHYGYNDFVISCGVKASVIKNYFANYKTLNEDFSIDFTITNDGSETEEFS